MPKVTIGGEVYDFDGKYPLHEAIEMEEKLGMTFGKWQEQLALGSARAVGAYIWLVLNRNGTKVSMEDIFSGKYPVDTEQIDIEDDSAEPPDPTGNGSRRSSATSAGSTSGSSPKSSTTPRSKSTVSRSMSSTT